ncbi:putative sulfate exporter family transporter, partial [Pseudomonas aeruginosa]
CGSLRIVLYPLRCDLGQDCLLLPRRPGTCGVFVGVPVHDVGEVVASGRSIVIEAADTADIANMVRLMMLAPFVILLSDWLAR